MGKGTTATRRRHCYLHGAGSVRGEEKCLDCDPVCVVCDDRVSEVGELNPEEVCAECVKFAGRTG